MVSHFDTECVHRLPHCADGIREEQHRLCEPLGSMLIPAGGLLVQCVLRGYVWACSVLTDFPVLPSQGVVQQFLVLLTTSSDESLQFLSFRLDFNEHYKAREPRLRVSLGSRGRRSSHT